MKLTEQDEEAFNSAITFHIYSRPLGTDRVSDHMKAGYNYCRAAQNSSNLNFKYGKYIPVICHNASITIPI